RLVAVAASFPDLPEPHRDLVEPFFRERAAEESLRDDIGTLYSDSVAELMSELLRGLGTPEERVSLPTVSGGTVELAVRAEAALVGASAADGLSLGIRTGY